MRFGPKLCAAVFLEGDALDCAPAKKGVVTDERGDITRADGVANGRVNEVGEVSDAALEHIVGHSHDPRRVLDNGYFWTLHKLKSAAEEAVFGYAGIGVDDEDELADANISSRPSSTAVLRLNLDASTLVDVVFVLERDFLWCTTELFRLGFHLCQPPVFDTTRKVECVIHVGSLLELSLAEEVVWAWFGDLLWT